MSVKSKTVIIKLFAVITLVCAALFFTLAATPFSASAATVNVTDGSVNEIFNWQSSTRWDDDGPVAIRKNETGDISYDSAIQLKRTFDVSENKEFRIKFQVPIFEHENRTLIAGQSGISDNNLRVRLNNLNNGKGVQIVYWLGDNTVNTQLATPFSVYDTVNWAEQFNSDWTMGVATDGSYFTLGFNTSEYVKHEIAGGQYGKVAVAQDVFADVFEGCECIEVIFSRDFLDANTQFDVKLLEVNGQSLAKTDGVVNDGVAPIVPKLTEVNGAPNIELNTPYSIQCKQWFTDETAQNAIYTVQPAYDVISGVDLSYIAKITNASTQEFYYSGTYNGENKCIEGIEFTAPGKYNLQVEVTDRAGNKGLSSPIAIDFGFVLEYRLGQSVIATECAGKGETGKVVNLLSADQVTLADGKVFVGWASLTDGKLYKAGEEFELSADSVLYAMSIDLVTLTGARVYVSAAKKGIIFESAINYTELDQLGLNNGGNYSTYISKIGTVITKTSNLTDLSVDFTISALEQKETELSQELYYDIEKGANWSFGDGKVYSASVLASSAADYTVNYSARSYVEITYSNGSTAIIYSNYVQADNSRSMSQVAQSAKTSGETSPALDEYI